MNGLGDAIYCRPFVRAMAARGPLHLETKWPDLYRDVPRADGEPQGRPILPRYDAKSLIFKNILTAIGEHFPEEAREPFAFDLPEFPKPELGRYAVIRPPMLRADFFAPARNPRPEYIHRAAHLLRCMGYRTVGVAHCRPCLEWPDWPLPAVDLPLFHGELSIPELMGLVSGAALVVGGPGWQVPAAFAYRVPCVVIYGGFGRANAPEKLMDPRISSPLASVAPDRFCMSCRSLTHDCDKTISDFDAKFLDALECALS